VGDSIKDENRFLILVATPQLAEFASIADAGKAALCLQSLPSDMGHAQQFPSETRANNRGAVQMATAQQPTH
jgi:hypothetical protein